MSIYTITLKRELLGEPGREQRATRGGQLADQAEGSPEGEGPFRQLDSGTTQAADSGGQSPDWLDCLCGKYWRAVEGA